MGSRNWGTPVRLFDNDLTASLFGGKDSRILAHMNEQKPIVSTAPNPFAHLNVIDPAQAEKFKAEHAAKMKESAKNWPGKKRGKRN